MKLNILIICCLFVFGCKDHYNDAIEWMYAIKQGVNINLVKNNQPDFIEIDWNNPKIMGNEKWYEVTKIKGNKDILQMTHYLVFVKDKYQYWYSGK
ncbi:hypothetical protein QJU96_08140 [Pasteurella skyensis]|uniref:Lipoprotein n=1 Tax=Phocoenobacter skyensis TaxID=97481 RepID=A0AAJ6NDD1_9PAST|nr:hypothetical protein [Pasteurella skyensis]MDP8171254.1 hypothetical protein [Pasteurella skyensis]MDP8174702.1 hypothetical protein [Pasteurella skyensis]